MTFLTALTLFMGGMLVWMGALIRFGKRYGLINNYDADVRAGKFGEAYARRVGLLSLLSGAACVSAGASGFWLKPQRAAALMLACVFGSLAAFRLHYVRSDRLRP